MKIRSFFVSMVGLLAKGIIWLLRKCVAEEAEETPRGRKGGIAKVFLIFPLFLFAVLGGLTYFLTANPVDPDRIPDKADEITGWCILILVPAALGWMLVYFLSFRVLVEENVMNVSSLLTRSKSVRLDEPFGFDHNEKQDFFLIYQKGSRIKIGWTVNGYAEFLNLVWMKSRRWPRGPHQGLS